MSKRHASTAYRTWHIARMLINNLRKTEIILVLILNHEQLRNLFLCTRKGMCAWYYCYKFLQFQQFDYNNLIKTSWQRTLQYIYHKCNIFFLSKARGELGIFLCGLNPSCVSTLAWIHETDAALNGMVREFFTAEMNVGNPAVTDDCGAG